MFGPLPGIVALNLYARSGHMASGVDDRDKVAVAVVAAGGDDVAGWITRGGMGAVKDDGDKTIDPHRSLMLKAGTLREGWPSG